MSQRFIPANTPESARKVTRDWERIKRELDREFPLGDQLNRIRSPKTHCPWNDHLHRAVFASGLGLPSRITAQILRGDAVSRTVYAAVSNAFADEAPARFLNQDLASSLLHTDLPAALKPAPPDLYPSMHLLWPKDLLESDLGYPLDSLIVLPNERLPLGLRRLNPELGLTLKTPPPGLAFAAFSSAGEAFAGTFLWDPDDWAKAHADGTYKPVDDNWGDNATLVQQITRSLQRLAVNSWLLLAYRIEGEAWLPGVAPDSGPARGVDPKGRKVPQAPVFIGPRFKTEFIDDPESDDRPRTATGRASPRSHWRRGHYHHVVIGKNRSERKMAWFKPTRVNH
jgi:hypothetical protein